MTSKMTISSPLVKGGFSELSRHGLINSSTSSFSGRGSTVGKKCAADSTRREGSEAMSSITGVDTVSRSTWKALDCSTESPGGVKFDGGGM